ncbi:MAG: HEAT repeat domain-containing protein [Deltaproteobacteria bacterium]|nr:HEAT repeat domain-containing protein [Deltaproteobacteria bacterium]
MADSSLDKLFSDVDLHEQQTTVQPQRQAAVSVDAESADEATLKAKTRAVHEAYSQIAKGIKNIGIYMHNTARHPEYLEPALEAIHRYGEAYGPMVVSVEASGFIFNKQHVFSETFQNESIPYKFYREGVRRLIFRPTLTMPEFQAWIQICMANLNSADYLGKNALSLMWESQFEDIEYVVVDSFKIDDMEEDDVEIEVDKIVNYLYSRLKSDSKDYLRFARLSAEDLDREIDDVEQIRGAIISGQPCEDELAARLQTEIELDERERMLPKLVNIVFKVTESAGQQGDERAVREVFLQLLDAMLLQEDFSSINQILTKFRAAERDPTHGDFFHQTHEYFVGRMGDEERLRKIGEILNTSRPRNPKEVFRYLYVLDATVIPPLLDILDTIEIQENRVIICDALVAIGKETPEPFAARLNSERSQLVRDMMYIIDRIDAPNKIQMFGQALKNPNLAVRLEALGVIARSRTEECRALISERLDDDNAQMRIQAARLLPIYDQQKAYQALLKLVKSDEFQKRDLKERMQVYGALGATQQPGALSYFADLLKPKGLFKKAQTEEQQLAIAGLSQLASIPSFQLLQAEAERKGNAPEVITAAKRGMAAVRKELFGEEEED